MRRVEAAPRSRLSPRIFLLDIAAFFLFEETSGHDQAAWLIKR
jgi:hypothetical protein